MTKSDIIDQFDSKYYQFIEEHKQQPSVVCIPLHVEKAIRKLQGSDIGNISGDFLFKGVRQVFKEQLNNKFYGCNIQWDAPELEFLPEITKNKQPIDPPDKDQWKKARF